MEYDCMLTCVEQTKGNGGFYFYLHPFGDLAQ